MILLLGVAIYSHPKALYLAPAVAVAAWSVSPKKYFSRYIYLSWLGLLVASGLGLAKQYVTCPEVPELQAQVLRFNINPLTLFTSPTQFFSDVVAQNSGPRWGRFFSQALIKGEYDIQYLPGVAVTRVDRLANILTASLVLVNLLAAVAAMALLVWRSPFCFAILGLCAIWR
jgi:hypothetical protein